MIMDLVKENNMTFEERFGLAIILCIIALFVLTFWAWLGMQLADLIEKKIEEKKMKRKLITTIVDGDILIEMSKGVIMTMYDNEPTKEEMYKKLFEKYDTKQIIVAIEELSELQKELCKMLRNGNADNIEHIKEEIADVSIMLDQLVYYFKIDKEDLLKIQTEKLNRTKERLL